MAARRQSSALLVVIVLLFPTFLRAQAGHGSAQSRPLNIYADMSADSDVIASLPPWKPVDIAFSVATADGLWCGISGFDRSGKLGFVRCDRLNRRVLIPRAPAPSKAALAAAAHSASPVSLREQRDWAIAATALLATFNSEGVSTLSSGGSVIGVRRLLQDSWSVSSRDELLRTLEWIDQGGHRQLFSELGARATSLSSEQLQAALSHMTPEDANSVIIARRYSSKYSEQSLTGWDYMRYISLCRWGVAAGYITEQDAWPRVMHAAQILQQSFSSWRDLGENYLVGRQFWSLRQTRIDGDVMRAIYNKLLSDPASPWNRIPWNIRIEASAAENAPAPPSATSAHAACDALQEAAAGDQTSAAESSLQTDPHLINCRDSRGWTPLHHAAFKGRIGMIQFLVAHGAAIEAADKDGTTPLHVAASAGDPDAIEALLKAGARIDALDHRAETPLLHAVGSDSVPAVEALLRHHASIEKRCNFANYTPLLMAARRGAPDTARVLIEHGANLEARDQDGFTPLSTAASAGHTDTVAALLDEGANVNTRSSQGATPLDGAASSGSIAVATLLLEHGAHINAGDAHGFTALHIAASRDQAEIADFLIAHGAAINARTVTGDTPLHWAAHDNALNAARLLLEDGAAIDPKDIDGNTPLHWAAARGNVEMTEFLIAHGADMKARTRFGCTPLRGAWDFHQRATAQVLLAHGAPQ